MNLLLIAPIKSPVLLIIELLLFSPIVLICFSWWYWRINLYRKINQLSRAIILNDKQGAIEYLLFSTGLFFYFLLGTPKTRVAKFLVIINKIVAFDIIGLTLSRAINLAIIQ